MLLFSIIFGIALVSCKKPTEPVDESKPGRRDYTWTIDTIKFPGSYQTLMLRIWGSSSNDIYLTGFNDVANGQMWHFDGEKWSWVRIAKNAGGTLELGFYLHSIFGFAKDNIWSVGYRDNLGTTSGYDSSLIIHYNGVKWEEISISRGNNLFCVWGSCSNDIWAGGANGSVFHYDGISWHKMKFRSDISVFSISGTSPANIYLMGDQNYSRPPESRYNFLFYYTGHEWALVDSIADTNFPLRRNSIWALDKNNIYIAGHGVFKMNNGSWTKVFSNENSFSTVKGTAPNNLFAVGSFCSVYHYNGNDWYRFEQFNNPDIFFTDIWTDGTEVFILGSDGLTTYVFHGK